MKYDTFKNYLDEVEDGDRKILFPKNNDYSGGKDAVGNFKTLALMLGTTALIIWSVYFMKHISAILTFTRTGKLDSEGIRLRIHDARNYLYLLMCLIKDAEEEKK
jgi:hypothetical protein